MTTTARQNATTALRAFQVLAVLSVVSLAFQFVTAGQLVPVDRHDDTLHAGGAIVLHVLTGLTAGAALLLWRASSGPVWPTVLAAAVFVLTFVQAYYGDYDTLYIHVPGALVLTVGSVWLAAWTFSARARA